MQFPITIGLHRSFLLLAAIAVSHGVAAMAAAMAPWPMPGKFALWAALILSAGLAWRSARFPALAALRLQADGTLTCQFKGGDEFVAAMLAHGATVHPWLTVFRVEVPTGRHTLVLLPDSASAEDFRRLRVWLRWRAVFGVSADLP